MTGEGRSQMKTHSAPGGRLESWLVGAPAWVPTLFAAAAAFCTYFCMYAFRKPFAAASYAGDPFFGLDLKTVFVISQVLGYTVSKFVGIKWISEVPRHRRLPLVIGLIAFAELALLVGQLVQPSQLDPRQLPACGPSLGERVQPLVHLGLAVAQRLHLLDDRLCMRSRSQRRSRRRGGKEEEERMMMSTMRWRGFGGEEEER